MEFMDRLERERTMTIDRIPTTYVEEIRGQLKQGWLLTFVSEDDNDEFVTVTIRKMTGEEIVDAIGTDYCITSKFAEDEDARLSARIRENKKLDVAAVLQQIADWDAEQAYERDLDRRVENQGD